MNERTSLESFHVRSDWRVSARCEKGGGELIG